MISIHLCNFPFQLFDATMTSREGYGQQNWYEQVKCNKPYHHANFDIDHIWRCLRKSQHQGFCYNLDGLTNKYFLLQVKQQTQLKFKKKKIYYMKILFEINQCHTLVFKIFNSSSPSSANSSKAAMYLRDDRSRKGEVRNTMNLETQMCAHTPTGCRNTGL